MNKTNENLEPGDEALEQTEEGDEKDPYREFMTNPAAIRYIDNASNFRRLRDYLLKFEPPLPESPAAYALAMEQLGDRLDHEEPAPEQSPDELTQGEVQQAERTELEKSNAIVRDAKAVGQSLRKRGEMVRYRNGAKIG